VASDPTANEPIRKIPTTRPHTSSYCSRAKEGEPPYGEGPVGAFTPRSLRSRDSYAQKRCYVRKSIRYGDNRDYEVIACVFVPAVDAKSVDSKDD
jgi:hypothetical protein